MEKYADALAVLGGFGAIGGLIDFMLWRSERARLEDWMIRWWLRFADLKWRNFGRAEATAAVSFLDSLVGPRLLSRKRWRVVTATSLAFLLFAAAYASVGTIRLYVVWAGHNASVLGAFNSVGVFWGDNTPTVLVFVVLFMLCTTVMFAVSLTVMRWIAYFAGYVGSNGIWGGLAFVTMVIIQIALFLYWNFFAQYAAIGLVLSPMSFALTGKFDPVAWISMYLSAGSALSPHYRLNEIRSNVTFDYRAFQLGILWIVDFHKAALDVLSTTLRLGFAMVFLGSFVFEPVVQSVVGRLWAGVIDSKKPVFTLVLSAIGAIYASLKVVLS